MLIVSGECGCCEGVDWFVERILCYPHLISSCLAFLLAEDSPRFAGTLFYVFLCIQEVSFSYIQLQTGLLSDHQSSRGVRIQG